MFNFENANENQKKAIQCTDSPLLIIAGPGTGKTFTLVKRISYLIEQKNVKPEEIMVATFTEKAAKELITRISGELEKSKIKFNLNDMYIGTFHSICLRIINENIRYSTVHKNYQVLDDFDQEFFIFKNIEQFQKIDGFDEYFLKNCNFKSKFDVIKTYNQQKKFIWKYAGNIVKKTDRLPQEYRWTYTKYIVNIVDTLLEELPDTKKMQKDKDKSIALFAQILTTYQRLLKENNVLDFSSIQTETYKMLLENKSILEKIRKKIRYIMVDEYQDTNAIQEKIVFLIGGTKQNICVVGDDDQGLYRFRGALVKNILDFENKFKENKCITININQNYRSTKQIVKICNKWMKEPIGFTWDNCRLEKNIKAVREESKYPSVLKIEAENQKNWQENILTFIRRLKYENKIQDYNQIAFLFTSLKSPAVSDLQNYLEDNCIDVYSPRSKKFFERREIKLIIGTLIYIFSDYHEGLVKNKYPEISSDSIEYYYKSCIKQMQYYFKAGYYKEIKSWIEKMKTQLIEIDESEKTYTYTSIIYELFAISKYKATLSLDIKEGMLKQRALRNLAKFTQIVSRFETLYLVEKLTSENIKKLTRIFFNQYIYFLYPHKIDEYEDESEYAPKGCVSFLTIHQSKGMEFPIVFVGSLDWSPWQRQDNIDTKLTEIKEKYTQKELHEKRENIKYYDFWRKYYTAFSRAQDMLILTCHRKPSESFEKIYESIKDIKQYSDKDTFSSLKLSKVKDTNIKNSYSYTSHINVYDSCPLKYKFFKELAFSQKDTEKMYFGSLVHQSIEDINKAAIEKEEITNEKISKYLEENINSLEKANNISFSIEEKEKAKIQLEQYIKENKTEFENIVSAEEEISLVTDNYIIVGQIDLVKKDKDNLEIVDFKTERKPDIRYEKEKIQNYEKQISIYAYILEKNTGKKVNKMTLYYTSEKEPKISFNYDKKKIEKYIKEFDQTAEKIMKKEYKRKPKNKSICKTCPLENYCKSEIKEKEE